MTLFLTIWIALALFVAGGREGLLQTNGRPPERVGQFDAGAIPAIARHSSPLISRGVRRNHEAAVTATAAQTASLYGFAWRGSLYVHYVFLALWLLAAWTWRHWAWRAFVLTMIVNGAIVFARPWVRPLGALLVAALLWAWWPRRARASGSQFV